MSLKEKISNALSKAKVKLAAFPAITGMIFDKIYYGANTPEKTDDVLLVKLQTEGGSDYDVVIAKFYDQCYVGPEQPVNANWDVSSLVDKLGIGNHIKFEGTQIDTATYAVRELLSNITNAVYTQQQETMCCAGFGLAAAIGLIAIYIYNKINKEVN